MILLAKIPSEVLFAAALGLLTFLLLRMSLHRYRRTKNDRPITRLPRPASSLNPGGLNSPANIARWEVQLHDQARQLSAQLDSKMLALGHLTASAARETDRLEKAIASAKQLSAKQLSERQLSERQLDTRLTPDHSP